MALRLHIYNLYDLIDKFLIGCVAFLHVHRYACTWHLKKVNQFSYAFTVMFCICYAYMYILTVNIRVVRWWTLSLLCLYIHIY